MKTLNNQKSFNFKVLSLACIIIPLLIGLIRSFRLPSLEDVVQSVLCSCVLCLLLPSDPRENPKLSYIAIAVMLLSVLMSLLPISRPFSPLPMFAVLAIVLIRRGLALSSCHEQELWYEQILTTLCLLDDWALAFVSGQLYVALLFSRGIPAAQIVFMLVSAGLYVVILSCKVRNCPVFVGKERIDEVRSFIELARDSVQEVRYTESEMLQMRMVFERVVALMETEKPFLSESYCMTDLSAAVYTNKLYLSKAINLMTGQNFRQFINTYRVNYSKELMRGNRDLKVLEVAVMSGFHSPVTFGMAFKLNCGETPGEYLQKLRAGLE